MPFSLVASWMFWLYFDFWKPFRKLRTTISKQIYLNVEYIRFMKLMSSTTGFSVVAPRLRNTLPKVICLKLLLLSFKVGSRKLITPILDRCFLLIFYVILFFCSFAFIYAIFVLRFLLLFYYVNSGWDVTSTLFLAAHYSKIKNEIHVLFIVTASNVNMFRLHISYVCVLFMPELLICMTHMHKKLQVLQKCRQNDILLQCISEHSKRGGTYFGKNSINQ